MILPIDILIIKFEVNTKSRILDQRVGKVSSSRAQEDYPIIILGRL